MRILIIDDNPAIHQDFFKILMVEKPNRSDTNIVEIEKLLFGESAADIQLPIFEIDTAVQGEEGFAKIKAAMEEGNPYSLAFVDIRMPPGWDGVETIKHIWEVDNSIQIVICTAYSDYTWEETIAELGERDNLLILKKPFDSITVRQLACALTKKWQLSQESKVYTSNLEKHIDRRTRQLKHQATHDTLTGLPNRALLNESIRKKIQIATETSTMFGVLFIDLDRFKLINDSLSHEAGDEVLKIVAHRFKKLLQKEDDLVRLGGDEFVIVTHNTKSPHYARELALQCLGVFDEPLSVKNHDVILTTSIGIAIYPRDGVKDEVLLTNADRAMYHAKSLGSNQFQSYSKLLDQKNLERLERENELRQAIAANEFYLEYQPQVDLQTENLVSVEALIRWRHKTEGVILPMEFIPLAEETGLIIPLGEWTLRAACRQMKNWQRKGLPLVRIAVNVTSKQIRLFNFPEIVKNILHETELDPQYLELELTENILINNLDVIKNLNALKEIGVQLALDDFGTGFSGLGYLRDVPIDRLKIDQSYVKNIEGDRGDDVIIEAILAMAKSLNLEVLAEGVETLNQLNFLKTHQCREVQGYYYSKPISAKRFEKLLQEKVSKVED